MLNVAVSDDGEQWQAAVLLEKSRGEYSYPPSFKRRRARSHNIHVEA